MKKLSLILLVSATFSQAIPIEVFKSKPAARFNNYGVTMNAKIKSMDCTKIVGYGNRAKKVCMTVTSYKRKNSSMDGTSYLYFNLSDRNTLQTFINSGRYGFIACTYTHKTRHLQDCSIK